MVEDSEQKTDPSSAGQSATDDSQKGEGSDTGQSEGDDGQSGNSGGGSEGDEPGDWEEIDDDRVTPYEEPIQGGGDGNIQATDGDIESFDTISVKTFLSKKPKVQVFVKGYIVASCSGKKENMEMKPPFTNKSALLMADRPDETDLSNMMAVQLSSGSKIRESFNLADHPNKLGEKLLVCGFYSTYMGGGMKDIGPNFWDNW